MDTNRISFGSSAFLIKDDELKKGWDYNITTPVGNHAITKEEFMKIYDIYKKYNQEHPLKMD